EKNFVVPSFFVKYWKKLAFSSLGLIVVLFSVIIYLATKQKEEAIMSQYTDALNEVHQKNKLLSMRKSESEKEIGEAKKSFNKIDSTLESINKKMKKRGLKSIALENAGGPIEADEENIELMSTFYEEALAVLDKKLESLPIGVPHHGEVTSRSCYRRNRLTIRGREMHAGIDPNSSTCDRINDTATLVAVVFCSDSHVFHY